MTMVASTGVAEVLLVLKIAFLVLLYLFVVRVIRIGRARAGRQPSQDSMILTPWPQPRPAGLGRGTPTRKSVRLVVQRSPSLETGAAFPLNSAPAHRRTRRAERPRARGRRVRVVPPRADRGARRRRLGAGSRVDERHVRQRLARRRRRSGSSPGDVLRVGETDLRGRGGADDAGRRVRGGERHGAQAAPQRGQLRRRAAALRRRRRDGRRAGRRGRVAARRLGARGRRLRRARGDGADRRADPGGEPPHLRPRLDRSHRLGHGHDDDRRARRGNDRRDRPRRRLARLPRPRRADGAADRGSLARERAAEDRQALRGGGADPPAAERDHAGRRHRSRRRRRRLHDRGRGRRRLPHLLRRAQRHGRGRGDPRGRPSEPRRPRQGGEGAGRGREQGRRRGQHHGRRLPDLVRGRAEPRGHGRDAGDHRGRRRARRADARVRGAATAAR